MTRTCTVTITGDDGDDGANFAIAFDPPVSNETDNAPGFSAAVNVVIAAIRKAASDESAGDGDDE